MANPNSAQEEQKIAGDSGFSSDSEAWPEESDVPQMQGLEERNIQSAGSHEQSTENLQCTDNGASSACEDDLEMESEEEATLGSQVSERSQSTVSQSLAGPKPSMK